MQSRVLFICVCFLVATSMPPAARAQVAATPPWDSVAAILRSPEVQAVGYQRFNFPRRDLRLTIGGVAVSPALALGAWAGFDGDAHLAMMMGDLVLTTAELGPVLRELSRQRIGVTAIHNHLVGETPAITYVHFHAEGDPSDLAHRLNRVLAWTGTPRPVTPPPAGPLRIDAAAVFRALGVTGRAQGDVAQASLVFVPGIVTLHGWTLVPALAYATPINVESLDGGRALASGDFALVARQVGPVLDSLMAHGIIATALHSHLLGEEPRLYYLHFWADGPLPDVLAGLRAAIDGARRAPS